MVWKFLRRSAEPRSVPPSSDGPRLFTAPVRGAGAGLLADGWSGRVALGFMRDLLGGPELLPGGLMRAERMILDDLEARCVHAPLSDDMVPRLPAVVPQVLRALRQSRTSADGLARIISGDTALVSDVVRLANSPYYGHRNEIESLSRAVVMLGDQGLRRLLMTAAMRPIIDARNGLITSDGAAQLWRKNQGAARAADFLAQRLAAPRFPAFLSGLLSQAGLLVLARALAVSGQVGFTAATDEFLMQLDALARRVTVRVCAQWEMPEQVVSVARALAGGGAGEGADEVPAALVSSARAADLLARLVSIENEQGGMDPESARFGLDGVTDSLAEACLEVLREGETEPA